MVTLTREEIASALFWFQVAEKEVTLTKAELLLAAKLALIADYPTEFIARLHEDANDTTDVELF
jgi:hypothetical protein